MALLLVVPAVAAPVGWRLDGFTLGGAAAPLRTVEGPLEVFVSDDFATHTTRMVYRLGPYTLQGTAAQLRRYRTGDRVRVEGRELPDRVLLVRRVRAVAVGAAPRIVGDQKTLVMVAHLSDRPNTTSVQAHADTTFNAATSVAAYFKEASRDQVTLSGTVVGPYLVNVASAGCNNSTIGAALEAAAKAAGVNVDSYPRRIYAFPPTGCSWWGYASIGGNPSRTWINGSYYGPVVAHELGHNLGLAHSHALECGTTSWCTPGQSLEYGDTVDVMGDAGKTGALHLNAYQKERLGWITVPQLVIPAGASKVDMTLHPYAPTVGAVAAKIAGASGDWFYVENRRRVGFDLGAPIQVEQGVLVHLVRGGAAYLLDMTETTAQWGDPALAAGRSFPIPNTALTLDVVAAGAQAQVSLRTGSVPPIPPEPTPGAILDDFTRANGPLGNNWTTASGTWAIQGNAARATAGAQNNRPVAVQAGFVGPTQTVSATFMRTANESTRGGVVLRYQDPKNYLVCYRAMGSPSQWVVSKVVNKVETVLARVTAEAAPVNAWVPLACRIDGATVSVGPSEGQWALVTSSSAFSTGATGLYAAKAGMQADSFKAFVGP